MNIKQLLAAQQALIARLPDENSQLLASHDYRHWLAESLGKNHSFLIAHDDYDLSMTELAHYQQGLEKLIQGIPLAYVTGHQPFWQGDFLVNQHTLIPRADTEIVVETALNFIHTDIAEKDLVEQNRSKKPYSLLDVGTGSGCILISLAMSLHRDYPQYSFDYTGVDISQQALDIAQQNAIRHEITATWLQGDWFSPFFSNQKFDIIVSNPPYIDPQDPHLADLTDEPITALVADHHGLADIFTIIEHAKHHLHVGGLLAIEHGYNQGKAVKNCFIAQGFQQVKSVKDYGGNDRVTCGILP